MTSSDSFGANEWDGVERRADHGNARRCAVIFSREISRAKTRDAVAHGAPPAASQHAPSEPLADAADASPQPGT